MSEEELKPRPRRMLGLHPGLLAIALFAVAGVISWQSGLIGDVRARFQQPEEPTPRPLVNVNTASVEELRALPDVDEKIARDIVKKRPFATIEDLKDVKGIGDKKLSRLRSLVRLK